jgi:hypothetical protein
MLTIGQARTFRVGGTNTKWAVNQADREVEWHIPAETPLMKHGDLLVFDGGSTLHSMFPTNLDRAFKPNGFDWRISIIFRWTTDIMREHGPGAEGIAIQDYKKQYDADRQTWRAANVKARVFSIRTGKIPSNVVYVGCKAGQYKGTVYGNDYEPFKGLKN